MKLTCEDIIIHHWGIRCDIDHVPRKNFIIYHWGIRCDIDHVHRKKKILFIIGVSDVILTMYLGRNL